MARGKPGHPCRSWNLPAFSSFSPRPLLLPIERDGPARLRAHHDARLRAQRRTHRGNPRLGLRLRPRRRLLPPPLRRSVYRRRRRTTEVRLLNPLPRSTTRSARDSPCSTSSGPVRSTASRRSLTPRWSALAPADHRVGELRLPQLSAGLPRGGKALFPAYRRAPRRLHSGHAVRSRMVLSGVQGRQA
jgi:hypothetical protein